MPAAVPQRPQAFVPVAETLASVDAQGRVRLAEQAAQQQAWAWLPLPDVDTTDAESRSRARARQIALRAIDAMGGMDALVAIDRVEARVWVEATEHRKHPCDVDCIVPLPPYPFLVEEWTLSRHGAGLTARSARARISLDPSHPSDRATIVSAIRDPVRTLERYNAAFGTRGPRSAASTEPGPASLEADRWHIVDCLLGEGIELAYLGAERYEDTRVEVVQVLDRKYGRLSEALFAAGTGLPLGLRDQRWDTIFGDYRRSGAALLPHRLERACRGCPMIAVIVHLQLGANGDSAPPEAPDLAEQGQGQSGSRLTDTTTTSSP